MSKERGGGGAVRLWLYGGENALVDFPFDEVITIIDDNREGLVLAWMNEGEGQSYLEWLERQVLAARGM